MPETKWKTHPSYGTVAFNRVNSSHKKPLFGSSILHNHVVTLSIYPAMIKRDLNQDDIMANRSPLVEVEMSATQFAEAITSLNRGEGTPCTVSRFNGKDIEPDVFENKILQMDEEFENKMKEIGSEENKYMEEIQQILLKPNLTKGDRQAISTKLDMMMAQISSSLPFIKKQFSEQMDKTILEAKNEIDSFLDKKVQEMGLEEFRENIKKQMALDA